MAQGKHRLPVILGDEEMAEVERICAFLGSDTSKNAAVRFAILEWNRNRQLIEKLQGAPAPTGE